MTMISRSSAVAERWVPNLRCRIYLIIRGGGALSGRAAVCGPTPTLQMPWIEEFNARPGTGEKSVECWPSAPRLLARYIGLLLWAAALPRLSGLRNGRAEGA